MLFNLFQSRVSTEVTFWNSAEDGIFHGSYFNVAEFLRLADFYFTRNSAEICELLLSKGTVQRDGSGRN